jgi:membrane-associated phospholipid phosphatase
MDGILNSGILIVLWFQSLGDWLLIPMKFFSFLGTEDFYLLALPVIYWGIDPALGLRLGVMTTLTSGINTIFKFALHLPRPYWVSNEVQAFSAESSFGAPSGHAQNAVALWGVWATYARKVWVWVIVIFVVLGISLSRLYLAVHFPFDTLLGWLLGLSLLVLFNAWWEPVASWAAKQSMAKQIGAAFVASMLMLLAGVGVRSLFGAWTMPTAWSQAATSATGHSPDPFALSGLVTSSATLFGLLAGVVWIAPRGGYQIAAEIKKRILQYLVGMVGIGLLYAGLKVIFPSGDDLVAYFFRFLRYTWVGFWVTGLAPFVFIKLKLTQ